VERKLWELVYAAACSPEQLFDLVEREVAEVDAMLANVDIDGEAANWFCSGLPVTFLSMYSALNLVPGELLRTRSEVPAPAPPLITMRDFQRPEEEEEEEGAEGL
jgi:hypothetical protein